MSFHRTRRRLAQGAAPRNALGHRVSPRLTASLTEVEVIRVVAVAERLGIPAAAVMRRAVAAYIAKFPPQGPQRLGKQRRSISDQDQVAEAPRPGGGQ